MFENITSLSFYSVRLSAESGRGLWGLDMMGIQGNYAIKNSFNNVEDVFEGELVKSDWFPLLKWSKWR